MVVRFFSRPPILARVQKTFFGSSVNLFGSSINFFGSSVNLFGSSVNLFGSPVNIFGALCVCRLYSLRVLSEIVSIAFPYTLCVMSMASPYRSFCDFRASSVYLLSVFCISTVCLMSINQSNITTCPLVYLSTNQISLFWNILYQPIKSLRVSVGVSINQSQLLI